MVAIVNKRPKCDFCERPAIYDGKTTMSGWAYMCDEHFSTYGIGLGMGKGQVLVVANIKAKSSEIEEAKANE
jgi:hypothetical protein